jgi:glycosyltransferase involved in cell wall biosynthesis
MPVRNGEATIRYAILSIINQTITNWELIIVNDGSSDRTVEIAKSFNDSRIRIIGDNLKLGIPFRLNEAINNSKGLYFARMDADDVSFPDRLAIQLNYLKKNPDVDLVASSILIFDTHGKVNGIVVPHNKHHLICNKPWKGFVFPHPTWMGHLSWFKKNKYPIEANGIEDQNLLFKSFEHSNFAGIEKVLLAYRDDRSLKKTLKKRVLILKNLGLRAIKNNDYKNLIIMSIVLPVKCIGDCLFALTKLKYFRNKLHPVSANLQNKWAVISSEYYVKDTYI